MLILSDIFKLKFRKLTCFDITFHFYLELRSSLLKLDLLKLFFSIYSPKCKKVSCIFIYNFECVNGSS